MTLLFRQGHWRYPFQWESGAQPGGRWHAEGDGPVLYLADTPEGAWAELLRHEGITDPSDLEGLRARMWCVEVALDDETMAEPDLDPATLEGGSWAYADCQEAARRLRLDGATGLRAPSAALFSGGAAGQVVDGGLQPGPSRDGCVVALFGHRPRAVGWVAGDGRPPEHLLPLVRPLEE